MKTILVLAAATAGQMSADNISLSGGTSIIGTEIIKELCYGIAMVLVAAGGFALANHRNRKRQRPLDSADLPVTCSQCESHRAAISKRLDEIGPALGRIFQKLDQNDKRSEERSQKTHERIDPLIAAIAETKGRVDGLEENIKAAWRNATVGGTK